MAFNGTAAKLWFFPLCSFYNSFPVLGKEISINDAIGIRAAGNAAGNKFVKVHCTNAESGKCKFVPFLHVVCFEKWEEQLIVQLRMRRITRDWNEEKIKRHLWLTDGITYCFRACKCPCGGLLTRVNPEDEVRFLKLWAVFERDS